MLYPFAGRYFNKRRHSFSSLLIMMLLPVFCVGCSFFSEFKETFHKPEIVDGPFNTSFFDAHGNQFFFYGGWLYECNANGKCERYKIKFDENYELDDSIHFVDDNFLYFYVTPIGKSVPGVDKIVIMTKQFEEVTSIYLDDDVRDMVVINGYLYYCYFDRLDNYNHNIGLAKINLNTFEKTLISGKCENGCVYNDQVPLFLQLYLDKCHIIVLDDNLFYSTGLSFTCYDSNFGTISSTINEETLIIEYQSGLYSFQLPYKKSSFYDYVYVKGDSIIFAIREYIDNSDCVPTWATRCICHYGRSSLYKFDLKTNDLKTTCEYDTGTVLIDYDETSSSYYCDGRLFRHGLFANECHKIIPEEEITIINNDYFHHDRNRWYIYIDDEKANVYLF